MDGLKCQYMARGRSWECAAPDETPVCAREVLDARTAAGRYVSAVMRGDVTGVAARTTGVEGEMWEVTLRPVGATEATIVVHVWVERFSHDGDCAVVMTQPVDPHE